MLSILTRACQHPLDYLPGLRTYSIIFHELIQESETIFSFLFTIPKDCTWKAGQHAVFRFPDTKILGKSWRAFSVASSPHEGVIRIGTIITEDRSDFKQHLKQLRAGDHITMRGPFGEFHASNSRTHAVGIAGGIGITPFRALAYDLAHGHTNNHSLTLIYSARPGQHTYRAELDAWAGNCDQLSVIYTETPEEVHTALSAQVTTHQNDASYFISGSPGMIGAFKTSLQEQGIRHIINDPFKGY